MRKINPKEDFRERGITLIALVVTIVVLLILAGVSINLVLGNNGIITKAKESKRETRMAQIDEQVKLAIGDAYADGIGSITDSGLKSALNNHIGEGTYDITGDETTGWKVTVKETGKVYEISANGKMDSSIDWDKIIEEANKNPESFKNEDQSETNKDIGIGTDGLPVNLDLWRYEKIMGKNEIRLAVTEGSGYNPGYENANIKNGKIQGKVPEYIKLAGYDEFFKVTSMNNTFAYCYDMVEAPTEIPSGVTSFSGTYMYCKKLTNVTIPNNITDITMAFAWCSSLTTIEIPNSVTSIGELTFKYCENLEKLIIPESVTVIEGRAFENCTKITSIAIPEGVTSIQWLTFYQCTGLTSITIPNSVTSIVNSAFEGCTNLTSINVDENNKEYSTENGILFDKGKKRIVVYPAGKAEKSYEIPNSVTSIGSSAFSGCASLTSITIPDSVNSIGSSAFSGCASLTSITIPDSVTSIESSTFYRCTGLTSIAIPDSVTTIGVYAFEGCTGLTSTIIPDSVNSIGSSAFSGCASLTSITIPDSVTSIGDHAFSGCASLTSITIPDSVTSIGDYAFYGCTSLTAIKISENVTSISRYAFYKCASLTSITIPDSVTSIGDYAFYGCTSLTSITIPEGVTSIDNGAFYDCDSLADVYFKETTAPNFGKNSFTIYSNTKTTFHFKNQTVYDAFAEDYYNKVHGEKSTDFNW